MTMACQFCAAENPQANAFCSRCGKQLSAAVAMERLDVGRTAPSPQPASAVAPPAARVPDPIWHPVPGPQYQQQAASLGPGLSLRGPFASRGTRFDRGGLVYPGRANAEAQQSAWLLEALNPFRAYQEYFDAKSAGMERRAYVTATRGSATVAIHSSTIGRDLYASWTMFSRRDLDVLRLIGLLLVALTLAIPGGVKFDLFTSGSLRWDWGSYFGAVVPWTIVLAVLLLWAGLTFRRDLLGYLRAPLNEFQLDDLHSLREATEVALRAWDTSPTPVSPKAV